MSRQRAKSPALYNPQLAEYSEQYVEFVRGYIIGGKQTNAEIAVAIDAYFRNGATEADVVRWRRDHPRFGRVCALALDERIAKIANTAFDLAEAGDTGLIKYILDRRAPAFMPKSKTEVNSKVEGLAELLASRAARTEEELREVGVIFDAEFEEVPSDAKLA